VVRRDVVTAPAPESLGRLFAEVFDLCDQVAATITDAEVEARLEALLATGVLDEATETWTDLDDMLAADLPPCELELFGMTLALGDCGRASVVMVRAKCEVCGRAGRFGACHEHASLLRSQRDARVNCADCGSQDSITLRGLS
jgi:hypothetical protein